MSHATRSLHAALPARLGLSLLLLLAVGCATRSGKVAPHAHDANGNHVATKSDGKAGSSHGDGLKLENLIREPLALADGIEVIVSKVTIPPNASLPKHWHPGEEYAYLLQGKVTLWMKGKPDKQFKAGQAGKIPLKQVHTAITGDEGATILVFRVHPKGEPERVLAE